MANGIVHPTPKTLAIVPCRMACAQSHLAKLSTQRFLFPAGTLKNISFLHTFIKELSQGERVCINIRNAGLKDEVMKELDGRGVDLSKIDF